MRLSFINKFYYGDIPEDEASSLQHPASSIQQPASSIQHPATSIQQPASSEWPLWEVFIRSKQGLDHKHAGSLHAADAKMAIENARDVYTRRMEGVSIWVVESKNIVASNPDEAGELYEPAMDKIYRHPTFYELPDEVNHM
jgi:ring-1,2-phenylacetyl-CoA epoxidase subunit PaaB